MHVFHVISTWLGYSGMVCALLCGTIDALWPEKKGPRRGR